METSKIIALYSTLNETQKEAIDMVLISFGANPDEDWISVSSAAEILGVSPQTVRMKISQGILPYRNCSKRKTLVEKACVERLAQVR